MAFHLQNQDRAFINSLPAGWPYEDGDGPVFAAPKPGQWQLRMNKQGLIVLWETGKPFPSKYGRGTVVATSDSKKDLEAAMVTFCQSLHGYFPADFVENKHGSAMGFNWTTGTPVQYGLACQVFSARLDGTREGYDRGWELGRDFQRRAEETVNAYWQARHAAKV
jgi:hypothetical protein